jgi:hypothetical protein
MDLSKLSYWQLWVLEKQVGFEMWRRAWMMLLFIIAILVVIITVIAFKEVLIKEVKRRFRANGTNKR